MQKNLTRRHNRLLCYNFNLIKKSKVDNDYNLSFNLQNV